MVTTRGQESPGLLQLPPGEESCSQCCLYSSPPRIIKEQGRRHQICLQNRAWRCGRTQELLCHIVIPLFYSSSSLGDLDLPQPFSSLIPLFQALVQFGLQGLILLAQLLTQGLWGRKADRGEGKEGKCPKES